MMHVRTVAAILVWLVVALLLLNRALNSELILSTSIVITVIAVLLYFSPRLLKNNTKPDKQEDEPAST
jgi:hypothetical protein